MRQSRVEIEHDNAVEIRNGIMFDFYLGLPHMYVGYNVGAHNSSKQ